MHNKWCNFLCIWLNIVASPEMYSRANNHYEDIMTESRLATYHNVCGKFLMKLNLCEKLWSHVKSFLSYCMLSILLAKGLLDSRLTCHLIDNNFLFLTINYIPLINSTFLILYIILCYYFQEHEARTRISLKFWHID